MTINHFVPLVLTMVLNITSVQAEPLKKFPGESSFAFSTRVIEEFQQCGPKSTSPAYLQCVQEQVAARNKLKLDTSAEIIIYGTCFMVIASGGDFKNSQLWDDNFAIQTGAKPNRYTGPAVPNYKFHLSTKLLACMQFHKGAL